MLIRSEHTYIIWISSTCAYSPSPFPDAVPCQILFPSGMGSGRHPVFGVNYKDSNRRSAIGRGLPEEANGIGDRRKTTETESRSSQSTVYACTRSYPPNLNSSRMPTNQITALPERARRHARVCSQALRVYKASPVVSKPFGLGLAWVRLR